MMILASINIGYFTIVCVGVIFHIAINISNLYIMQPGIETEVIYYSMFV